MHTKLDKGRSSTVHDAFKRYVISLTTPKGVDANDALDTLAACIKIDAIPFAKVRKFGFVQLVNEKTYRLDVSTKSAIMSVAAELGLSVRHGYKLYYTKTGNNLNT